MADARIYATDGEFFQVIRKTATTVTVRPIMRERTGYERVYTCFDYDVEYVALPDQFTTSAWLNDRQNEVGKRCKVGVNGNICINRYFGIYAYPCDNGVAITNHNLG